MYHKQYITIREACIYTKLSRETIQTYIRQGLLSSGKLQNEIFLDPDELDLLIEHKNRKFDFVKIENKIRKIERNGWRDSWVELKDGLMKENIPLPTFTNSSGPDYSFATYKRKKSGVEVKALLIQSMFRVISDNHPNIYAIKTPKEGGYLVQFIKNKEVYLFYRSREEFEDLFQYSSGNYIEYDIKTIEREENTLAEKMLEEPFEIIPVYKTIKTYQKQQIGITEKDMLDYIFSHAEFREELKQKLLGEDYVEQEIVKEMLEDE